MSAPASVGVVYGAWYDPPGYYYGDAMAGPLCQDCHRAAGYDVNDPDAHPIPCDGETDTPTHCEQCEALIAENLTREGEEYVRDTLTNPAPWSRPGVLAAWREAYGYVLEGGQA